jgi:hypothetical protein
MTRTANWKQWTNEENRQILETYHTMPPREFLARHAVGHSLGSLMTHAHKIGAQKHKPAYDSPDKLWTEEELKALRDNYATMPVKEIKRRFLPRRSIQTIWKRATIIGLNQSRASHRTHGEAETTEEIFKLCSESDKPYLAGILDGEGSIGYYWKLTGRYRSHQSCITITNCDNDLMEWLKLKFGHVRGAFCTRKAAHTRRYVCYHWEIWGNQRVRHFLVGVLPYLIVKLEQAELLLGPYPETIEQRQELMLKMRAAKTSRLHKIRSTDQM